MSKDGIIPATGSSSRSLSWSSSATSSTLCPWSRWTGRSSCVIQQRCSTRRKMKTWSTWSGESLSGSISLSPSVFHSYCNSSPSSISSPARIGIPSLERESCTSQYVRMRNTNLAMEKLLMVDTWLLIPLLLPGPGGEGCVNLVVCGWVQEPLTLNKHQFNVGPQLAKTKIVLHNLNLIRFDGC